MVKRATELEVIPVNLGYHRPAIRVYNIRKTKRGEVRFDIHLYERSFPMENYTVTVEKGRDDMIFATLTLDSLRKIIAFVEAQVTQGDG
jgi:hypothetical protein